MTAYTSTGTGDWNSAATWGGGGYPNASGDTATISADHTVTIPVGVSIDCGAITINDGSSTYTQLTINGSLKLYGTLTGKLMCKLNGNGAFVFDLNGNLVTFTDDYSSANFLGASGARGTITSTSGFGTWTTDGIQVAPHYEYVDFSNLQDAILGRSQTSFCNVIYKYCTFTNMKGNVWLDRIGTATNTVYDIQYCDFRAPNDANPVSADAKQPAIDNQQGLTTGTLRQMLGCTFDSGSTLLAKNGLAWLRCTGLVHRENVFRNWNHDTAGSPGATKVALVNNLHAMILSDDSSGLACFASGVMDQAFNRSNYGYQNNGGHPWPFVYPDAYAGPGGAPAWVGNVWEGWDASNGGNWLLSSTDATAGLLAAKHNLVMGAGALFSVTGNMACEIELKQNTVYSSNGADSSSSYISCICTIEASGTTLTSGTARLLNNLALSFDSSIPECCAVGNVTGGPYTDAIDYWDYNCGYGYNPSATQSPPLPYNSKIVITGGVGVHDFSADPQLFDKTRKLATWGASLGGSGTVEDTLTRMLAREAGYKPSALISWVFDGFRFSNTALLGTGENGVNIGAANYYNPARSMAAVESARTLLSSLYV